MRILIVDPERRCERWEREPGGPLSFFFSDRPDGAASHDLIVLPAELFLGRHEKLPEAVPIFAYGPASLAADALAGGCSDFLRDPWPREELEARALRYWRIRFSLGRGTYQYCQGRLEGGKTSCRIPESQRKVLELLLHRLGKAVPRAACARTLGLDPSRETRLPDMTITRLRKNLARVSGDEQAGTFLVPVRNYGYLLDGKPCG